MSSHPQSHHPKSPSRSTPSRIHPCHPIYTNSQDPIRITTTQIGVTIPINNISTTSNPESQTQRTEIENTAIPGQPQTPPEDQMRLLSTGVGMEYYSWYRLPTHCLKIKEREGGNNNQNNTKKEIVIKIIVTIRQNATEKGGGGGGGFPASGRGMGGCGCHDVVACQLSAVYCCYNRNTGIQSERSVSKVVPENRADRRQINRHGDDVFSMKKADVEFNNSSGNGQSSVVYHFSN
mmetsp:Transcript_38844/g.63576  ORF Transcript_38844/g.63576 Transcript_38844/m.63576 type:complete len:235 (+) Transcript_38844:187-891(+)